MIKFQSIIPIKPLNLKPTALTKLAAEMANHSKFSPLVLPSRVNPERSFPRSLDEIFMDLEEGQGDRISCLEWVYCLEQKPDWDVQHSQEQQLNTSGLIWQAAFDNYLLKQRLCWRLAYYHDGDKKALAGSLVETFSTLADIVSRDDLMVEILASFKQRDPLSSIANLALIEKVTPQQLFKMAALPTNLNIFDDLAVL